MMMPSIVSTVRILLRASARIDTRRISRTSNCLPSPAWAAERRPRPAGCARVLFAGNDLITLLKIAAKNGGARVIRQSRLDCHGDRLLICIELPHQLPPSYV